MSDQPHTPHIEEVCSAYVQYHHFNSYGMDDSEETEKGFYRMITQVRQEAKAQALRDAAKLSRSLWQANKNLRDPVDPESSYSFDVWLERVADQEGSISD